MLSRVSSRRYALRSRSISLLILCASYGLSLLVLVWPIAIVRAADDTFPHFALYSINADGSSLQQLAYDPNYALWGPSYSSDGKHIALTFVSLDMQRTQNQLYILDADGKNPRQLTHNERGNFFVEWSHDSSKLAFFSQQGMQNETAEIYAINADGSDERRLTNNTAWEYGATWSPDDRQIAFGSNAGDNWQIWMMDADGSDQRPLLNPAHGNAPRWSPDGHFIVIKSDREGNDNIYVMEPDGINQQNVTHDSSINNTPSWSPDSQKVVFWSDREGTPNIYVMNHDGSQLVNLTHDSGLDAQFPSWSPDGKRIIFMAVPLETGIAAYLPDSAGMLLIACIGVLALVTLLVVMLRRHRNLSRVR